MTEIWIAPEGSDGGSGSYGSPFATGPAAHAVAAPGDTISAKPGLYTTGIAITKAGITFRGVGGSPPLFYGGTALTGSWTVHAGSVYRLSLAADPITLVLWLHDGTRRRGDRMDDVAEIVADGQWAYDSGAQRLYLRWSGNPGTELAHVDKVDRKGTASVYTDAPNSVFPFGGVYVRANDVVLEHLAIEGWGGSGHLGEDAARHVLRGVQASRNAEDGGGGFALTDNDVLGCDFDENGVRRARQPNPFLGGFDVLPDGNGYSLHNGGAVESTGRVVGCRFRRNTKNSLEHPGSPTVLMQRCLIVGNNLNFVANSSGGVQTLESSLIVAEAGDLGAVGLLTLGTLNLRNVTIIGAGVAGVPAIRLFAGTLDAQNCVVSGWAAAADVVGGTFTHDHNSFGGNTAVGVALGTGDLSSAPLLVGSPVGDAQRARLTAASPLRGAGVDGGAVRFDFNGRPWVPGRAWDMGCFRFDRPRPYALRAS